MNPPSALNGAMNKERKPFTYTPGGLDLSEIKSERMAKRLIRNAMDQGVPDQPISNFQLPPTPPTTLNVPNFNCLPVQVFPTFTLPANPKSLLRTRSNLNQYKVPCEEEVPCSEQLTTNVRQLGPIKSFEDNNSAICIESVHGKKDSDCLKSLFKYNTAPNVHIHPKESYERSKYTEPVLRDITIGTQEELNCRDNRLQYNESSPLNIEDNKCYLTSEPIINISLDIHPIMTSKSKLDENKLKSLEEITATENKQEEVKVIKKQTANDKAMEQQNGDSNIDTNVEAAVIVKLPAKKSAAKTETKVEVVKKVLPDGSIEEVKTTTTRTTIDGKTEITTKTETTIIPKEDEDEEFVEEEEEEEQENYDKEVVGEKNERKIEKQEEIINDKAEEIQNDFKIKSSQNFTKQEETSESSTTKNVTIIQSTHNQENSEEEIEEEEEEDDDEMIETIVSKTEAEQDSREEIKVAIDKVKTEPESDQEEVEGKDDKEEKMQQTQQEENVINNDVPETEEEIEEEEEEPEEFVDVKEPKKENENLPSEKTDLSLEEKGEVSQESEKVKLENIEKLEKETNILNENEQTNENNSETVEECEQPVNENKEEVVIEVQVLKPELSKKEETKAEQASGIKENEDRSTSQMERIIPLREPSVPLEKVEDVEIKPIGQIISKSLTENTEIITTSIDKPTTGLSTQTAYNRIENIVTVNRTTKTMDHAYEQIAQHGLPTVKTYFAPNVERLPTLPQSSRPYQPVYPSEPQTERRHSLLLDRLSADRQMPPTELYQSSYQSDSQSYDQNQWSHEPQSEVLTVSNVKPSSVTKNQQWYQQTKKEDSNYENAIPSITVPSQQWIPQQSQSQPQPQAPLQSSPQYQPQLQFQPSYIDTQNTFKTTSNTSNTNQHNSYSTYTPKPTSWADKNVGTTKTPPCANKQANYVPYVEKDALENYQKSTHQFSSSYIPPPWEQDSNYVSDNLNQSYYPPPSSNNFTNSDNQTWPPAATSNFSKPKPTSYIPPAPNQSFVKSVTAVDLPKLPGRKTYYSEYERRYISVPESTYIPGENKFQAQPDPSPQYYYDNYEPSETAEHEWRKELREFSEKTQTQTQSEQTLVKPPWEEDPKYFVPKVTTEYTPTPTWSQTLRPRSWRERSFESEFVRSKELLKTNTLGRGRPQSSYVKNNISTPIPERPRGVSVDRYNPNNYQSPAPSEYPPVQSHTLDPVVGAKTQHNPNVPAYHTRASVEPTSREQMTVFPQTRQWGEARASPIQSRSFKYLQWITGTEN